MQNHGVCLMEQARPSATGPIQLARPARRPTPNLSHRHTASTRKGRNTASVPPDPKMAAKAGTASTRTANHRTAGGTRANRRTPVTIQATKSVQSTIWWRNPRARAGTYDEDRPGRVGHLAHVPAIDGVGPVGRRRLEQALGRGQRGGVGVDAVLEKAGGHLIESRSVSGVERPQVDGGTLVPQDRGGHRGQGQDLHDRRSGARDRPRRHQAGDPGQHHQRGHPGRQDPGRPCPPQADAPQDHSQPHQGPPAPLHQGAGPRLHRVGVGGSMSLGFGCPSLPGRRRPRSGRGPGSGVRSPPGRRSSGGHHPFRLSGPGGQSVDAPPDSGPAPAEASDGGSHTTRWYWL